MGHIVMPSATFAEKSLGEIQEERDEIKEELSANEKKLADILIEMDEIDKEVKGLEATLEANQKEIDKTESDIEQVEEEIEKLEKKIEERFEILQERAKSYQESGGDIGYLEVLFHAKDFNEFLSRMSAVSKIADADAKLIEEQEEDKRKVEEKLEDLESLRDELKAIEENIQDQKESKEAKKTDLKKKKKKVNTLVDDLEMKDNDLSDLQSKLAITHETNETSASTMVAADTGNGELGWPTDGGYISSPMGIRWGKMHKGIDIARTDRSTSPPIYAAEDGTVETAGFNDGGYGNMVTIQHGNGMKTLYGHMSSLNVKSGQKVKRGDQIGVMGDTGASKGIHLHFEVHVNGSLQNPTGYIQ